MTDKSSDKKVPPNPFLLPATVIPGTLFPPSQTSPVVGTSTVLPTLTTSSHLSGSSTSSPLFPIPDEQKSFQSSFSDPKDIGLGKPGPFSSCTVKPSEGSAVSTSWGTNPADANQSTIFKSPQPLVPSTVPTLFGGTKRSSDNVVVSQVPGELQKSSSHTPVSHSGSDMISPVSSSSAKQSLFSCAVSSNEGNSFMGMPPAKIFGGSEAVTKGAPSLFGGSLGVSGQFNLSTGVKTNPFAQVKLFAGGPSSTTVTTASHTETGSIVKSSGKTSSKLVSLSARLSSSSQQAPAGQAATSSSTSQAKLESGRVLAETTDSSPSTSDGPEMRESGQNPSGSPEYSKKELTKIIVAQIPDNCLERDVLKAHFSKFGEIKRMLLNPKVNQATILYHNHHDASRAKRKGRRIHPKLPEVKIFYGTPARRKSEEAASEAALSKKKAIRTLQQVHQPSDLDPYTPLPRPGVDAPAVHPLKKPPKPKAVRSLPEAPPVTISRLPTPKKSPRKKSPAKEAKEPRNLLNEDDPAGLLERQALNNQDRYAILKARDKLLRKERKRTSDLKKASYLAATCPDMCPELERYMRDVQYDLNASYETTNGLLDHRLLTKKFSRSSADKDVPLPHELRPGPVLLRTMDFLVCNVIGRGDEEGIEMDVWYNYLWNRTRAVRNDLMQQQLTDASAVAIMERCTRFHIYAAARLCDEPVDLFDAKMNTEHLTKSLQTLKELYHDLGERGEVFPTESEFRAYEMLLSLNDGETTMHQYSQYRVEVQRSLHVQFALKVVLAVTFNNYIKFFKLIRRATYLQGCLMHRYFRQVRSRALETIIRSYLPPKAPQTVPLQTIIVRLGFEGEDDAAAYLQCHGISIQGTAVVLDKHSFISKPEELPPLVRPLSLVEVNRTVSVGEVIQGGPIPDNPLFTHIPHDSFDEQGYLKAEAKDASDQSEIGIERPLEMRLSPVVQQPEAQQNYQLVSHMKDVYSIVEATVMQELATQICIETLEEMRSEAQREEVAQNVSQELLRESVQWEVKLVSQEGYREVEQEERERRRKQREEEERKRKALEEMRNSVADMIQTDYGEQFVADFVRQVCEETVLEVSMEVAVDDMMKELPHQLCNEVVLEEVTMISKESFEEIIVEQERKIELFQRKVALRRTAEHFQMWRRHTQRARRHKLSQVNFPASCSSLTLSQQSEALGWGYLRKPSFNMSAPKLAQLEASVQSNLRKLTVKNLLVKECAWHPLPLQHHLEREVGRPRPAEHNLLSQYFKVVVCRDDSVQPEVVLWLRSKLGGQENQDLLQPLSNSFSFLCKNSGVEYAWVIEEVSASSLSLQDLQGTSVLLSVASNQALQDVHGGRVKNLLSKMPGIFYYEINFNCRQEGSHGWRLAEEDLVKPETSDKLQGLLLEFWRQHSDRVFIGSSHLNDFVYSYIMRRFLEPALKKQSERDADGKSPLPPCALVDLYNASLDSLLQVVVDEDLATLQWPPPELAHLSQSPPLSWNKEDMTNLAALLTQLRLPVLRLEDTKSWARIRQVLYDYAISVSGPAGEAPVLVSHIDFILSHVKKSLGESHDQVLTEREFHPLSLPWPHLVYTCASYKLSGLPETLVYYQPKRLESFTWPQSWWAACGTSDPGWAEASVRSCTESSRKRKAEGGEELEGKVTKAKTVHSKFLEDIAAERQKSADFEKNLESMLDIEEELKLLYSSKY